MDGDVVDTENCVGMLRCCYRKCLLATGGLRGAIPSLATQGHCVSVKFSHLLGATVTLTAADTFTAKQLRGTQKLYSGFQFSVAALDPDG